MVRLANIIGATQLVLLVGLVIGAGWEGVVIGVLVGSATAVGWLLASRIPQNPLGWMLLFVAGCFALGGARPTSSVTRWPSRTQRSLRGSSGTPVVTKPDGSGSRRWGFSSPRCC